VLRAEYFQIDKYTKRKTVSKEARAGPASGVGQRIGAFVILRPGAAADPAELRA
jgi:hypothetical protein